MANVAALIEQLQKYALKGDEQRNRSNDATSTAWNADAAQAVADELIALQAIYGDENVSLLSVQHSHQGSAYTSVVVDQATPTAAAEVWQPDLPIRLAVTVPLDFVSLSGGGVAGKPEDKVSYTDAASAAGSEAACNVRISATLPLSYPYAASPPQLQLLSRYIGPYGVDHSLFGQTLRIFMQGNSVSKNNDNHVAFDVGQVVLFDGIEKVRELIETWYIAREDERQARESTLAPHKPISNPTSTAQTEAWQLNGQQNAAKRGHEPSSINANVKLVSAPPIIERKSTFVGHAARLSDPADVQAILSHVREDRRIARATHPTIYAWVCRTSDGILHRDCNDDGEQAAGGRLAHLLDLTNVQDAIVIVTRWYGGVLLGPDRFKLINRAARDALELAGLIDQKKA